ncbi:MAG TPA: gephyrin-like molybdotransferase Glp [Candidatus Bathyarchaeia archaeon]
MTMKPFGELTTRENALRIIDSNIRPIERTEKVPLEEAAGRVLASDIVAGFDVPPFDRASMDGYAVRAADTAGATEAGPARLRLVAVQHTGEVYKGRVGKGECVEIATGGPVPLGCDAVVKVEDTSREGDDVLIRIRVVSGKDISPAGEDMKKGDRVLEAGSALSPGMVGALAALGHDSAEVYAKPMVAIYSSGPEVAPQGEPLRPGQVYDVNSFTLYAVVEAMGGVPVKRGIVADDEASIDAALEDASGYDMGVFSGGSSVGSRDLFVEAVGRLGVVHFHGVKVKPGKPTLFGEVAGTPVFGMPGYPTSCLTNSYVFLTPALRRMARLPPLEPQRVTVPLGHRLVSRSDRETFITVRIEGGRAHKVFKQSGDITSMAYADGYIIVPEGDHVLEEGEPVEVTLLPRP